MSIEVIKPGLLSTLQDSGRYGFQHLGVLVNGAMDIVAHRVANLLLGNGEDTATIEMTLRGPQLKFASDALIAITGADMCPTVDGIALPLWRPVWVRAGAELRFGYASTGCRTYLAVKGGFAVAPVLGSCSTYLRGALGGYQGRALAAGDRLALASAQVPSATWIHEALRVGRPSAVWPSWGASQHRFAALSASGPIRVMSTKHTECFSSRAWQDFLKHAFKVSVQADRMGYRLEGHVVEPPSGFEALSEAVAFGSIQVPPDGMPIVLMADRQPTGGYPCIGVVASVDLPRLAQMRPGETVRFVSVEIEEAERLVLARERLFAGMANSLAEKVGDQKFPVSVSRRCS